jgi:hypothetical protein
MSAVLLASAFCRRSSSQFHDNKRCVRIFYCRGTLARGAGAPKRWRLAASSG